MRLTRRRFVTTTAMAAGTVTFLPYMARAQMAEGDMFSTDAGDIAVHPIAHASFVMETPAGVIYVDPVGDPASYADLPAPDLILMALDMLNCTASETIGLGDGRYDLEACTAAGVPFVYLTHGVPILDHPQRVTTLAEFIDFL